MVNPSKGCYGSAVVCMFCCHCVVKAPNVQVILAKSQKPKEPKNPKKPKKPKNPKIPKKPKNRKKQISETLAQVTAHSESSGKLFFFGFFGFFGFFVFCLFFSVFFLIFLFFLVFGCCQYYLCARSFDHKMTAKHANNCTPRVARSVYIYIYMWLAPFWVYLPP